MDEGMNRKAEQPQTGAYGILTRSRITSEDDLLSGLSDRPSSGDTTIPSSTDIFEDAQSLSNTSESTILATESHERLQEQHFVSSPTASQVLEVGGNAFLHKLRFIISF